MAENIAARYMRQPQTVLAARVGYEVEPILRVVGKAISSEFVVEYERRIVVPSLVSRSPAPPQDGEDAIRVDVYTGGEKVVTAFTGDYLVAEVGLSGPRALPLVVNADEFERHYERSVAAEGGAP